MIDGVLSNKKVSTAYKITVKSLIGVFTVLLAVALPQFVHLICGASGGVEWLPMYLPVLIGGCLLGAPYGIAIGLVSPVASFLFTSAFLSPMPALARLPFMMCELAVFGAISGLFTKKIAKNGLFALPAVLLAELCGRGIFVAMVAILQNVTTLLLNMVLAQVRTGLVGLFAQAILVPAIVMALRSFLVKSNEQ